MTTKKRKKVVEEQNIQPVQKFVIGKTPGQQNYIDTIRNNHITLCNGCYGTGKTYISIGVALEWFRAGKVNKIVISRPAVTACGESQGYYPGAYDEKLEPFMIPILSELENFATKQEISKWMETGVLELMPLALLRGQNWNYCFVIIDECANLTFDQLVLILSRFGKNSKLVLSGDFNQSDLPKQRQGAFEDFFEILHGMENVGLSHLTRDDIVRSPFVKELLVRVEKWKEEVKKPVRGY